MDGDDELLGALIVHWRVTLATVLALIGALILVWQVDSFTWGFACLFTLAGFGAGVYWENRARAGRRIPFFE